MNIQERLEEAKTQRKCFFIAELGLNHNGDFEIAEKMIELAAKAGADAVKFQAFIPEKYVLPNIPVVGMKGGDSEGFQIDLYRKFVFSKEQYRKLIRIADENNVFLFATVFANEATDMLNELNAGVFKIASCDITNIPLIEHTASFKKPIILSTGMADLEEIDLAVETVRKRGNNNIFLLYCVSEYPPIDVNLNLKCILLLYERYSLPVGFSDHSLDDIASLAAVGMGACIIEKHFTLSRNLPGVDHYFSLDPQSFTEMVQKTRRIEKMIGKPEKGVTQNELEMQKSCRRGIKSTTKIKKGTTITSHMIAILRPETGLHPKELSRVLGKKAIIDIDEFVPLEENMLQL